MQNRFSVLVLTGGILASVIIYFLHLAGFVNVDNEIFIRYFSLGFFLLGVILLTLNEIRRFHIPFTSIKSNNTLIVIPFIILVIATIFHRQIGIYATGLFVFMTLIHVVINKKLYKLNRLYYFLFGYVFMLIIGTINTQKGFHFPELTYSFILIPLTSCFFSLTHETLLRILRLFLRGMAIYLIICVLYWWYNFLHLDTDLISWLTQKDSFVIWLPDWKNQIRLVGGITFPAYLFVNSWSYYYHPSYISFVLFAGIIAGFYLYFKKNRHSYVSKFELILFIVLCLIVTLLMESRIGLVGCCFILAVSGLYYAKLKLKYFKYIVIIYIVLGSITLFYMQDSVEGFLDDKIRKTYTTLAIHYIEDSFWWGSGTQEQHIALEYQEELMKNTVPPVEKKIVYAHNQFIGDMVQFGIWGLIVLMVFLYSIIHYSIKERSYLLQMFISVTILFMMIEEPLYTQEGITRFTVFLVFFLAISDSKKERKHIDFGKNGTNFV